MKLNKIRLLHRCVNELRDRPTEKIKSQPSPEVSPSFFFYCNNEIYYILRQNIMFFFCRENSNKYSYQKNLLSFKI